MSAVKDLQGQLAPLLASLEHCTSEEDWPFFRRVLRQIEGAVEVEDLMGPFMELSTTAFRGLQLQADALIVVDEILAIAQSASTRFASGDEVVH